MSIRNQFRKSKILTALSSLKITVSCLMLLFILTFWGTIAQVQNGLYLAQERFFHSFFFLAAGFIPFPGAQLVMWVMFFNLTAVMLIRFVYTWRGIGILIIHFGLMSFLISGYVLLNCAQESHLTLKEDEASNVSTAFHDWELAVWEDPVEIVPGQSERAITSIDMAQLNKARSVNLEKLGIEIRLLQYYRNAHAYTSGAEETTALNASGIGKLEEVKLEIEPEKNTPGAIIEIVDKDGGNYKLLLYGAESKATQALVKGKRTNFSLRLKRYPLPFMLKLIDFIKEEHPGTETARSYKSLVSIKTNGVWREKLIYMNNPLRYKNYTFYQSSFSIDQFNQERSTLAVVRNSGQWMPYLSTFVTFAGLVTHFVMMALNSRKRKQT